MYVASVALGAKDEHTLKAFVEAEAYDGPAIIIAYSHCISHGINMAKGLQQQKAWVDSGRILLYRYNPDLALQGKNPLIVEGKGPKGEPSRRASQRKPLQASGEDQQGRI